MKKSMAKKILKRVIIAVTIAAALAAGSLFLRKSEVEAKALEKEEQTLGEEEQEVKKEFKEKKLLQKTAAKRILQLRESAKEIAQKIKEEEEKQKLVQQTEKDLQEFEDPFYFWEQDFQERVHDGVSIKERIESQRKRLQKLNEEFEEFKEAKKKSAPSQHTKESLQQSVLLLRRETAIGKYLLTNKTESAYKRLEILVEHIDSIKSLQDRNLQDYLSRLEAFGEEALEITQQLESASAESLGVLIDLDEIERQLK